MAIGGYYVINGQNFNAGDVTEFSGYFTTIIWPMLALAQIINLRSRGNASLNRIAKLLEEKPEIVDASEALQEPLQGEITMKHLYFSYPGSFEPTLKDISLHIEKVKRLVLLEKLEVEKPPSSNFYYVYITWIKINCSLMSGISWIFL